MPETSHPAISRLQRPLRILIVLVLSASVLWAAIGTIHWPIVGDAPLLHYVAFLIDHGKAPYRQIIEMDAPGTYALEWTAIHVLGPGPLAWRFADFLLIAACWLSMVSITWDEDWLAGFFGGAMFALIHFRDGPTHTGQRDLMMTAMLLPACAALFYAFRNKSTKLPTDPGAPGPDSRTRVSTASPFLLTLFGLSLGMATIVKPSGLFFAAVFAILLWVHLRKLAQPKLPAFTAAILGFLIPLAITAAYLQHEHALTAFFITMHGLAAYHASLGRPSMLALIIGSFPSVLLAVAIPALPVFFAQKPWKTWQGQFVLAGVLLGCASYILQGKGFPYHRYPTEAFLLLLIGTLTFPLLQRPAWVRSFALLTILGALFLAPVSASIANHFDWRNQEFNRSLASNLTALGPNLQNQIQCFDNTAGCINTLYNLQIVQATGYLYDCYAFQSKPSPYQDRYRHDFLATVQQAAPRILVVTDQDCFTMNRSFTRLDRWPQFLTFVAQNYTLTTQYTPHHTVGWWRHPSPPFSYRIYLRKTK